MSSEILNKGKEVLKTSWGIFDSLYYNFLEIAQEQKILEKNRSILELISYMGVINENPCNSCFDIADFIKDSKSAYLLMGLLEETIKKIKHELKDWAIADLWKFHAELVKYKEELESQGK